MIGTHPAPPETVKELTDSPETDLWDMDFPYLHYFFI
jgi:hypothetical protein